ncbi:flavin-containing monooxygenase [Nocardioides antri]|uniref:NAD(P)/FAD-dependent oxidoreductase n=1 Tax=Nocardioides antri TaxID=2607659 RepID=A0A5B1M547_9ACTN|nr:NAD(P)/FAD-dependent oxidoreductase [Nocardioides antri]KAA1427854.1 NAD(P)/FAD-dependent oxidoreductase [Nocardioides antri]
MIKSHDCIDHHDIVIVGAGLSGIAAAVELRREHPERTFVMLDQRDDLGGTWDLFRYPGIRSDSDMFTLGYAFKPWTQEKAIASGEAILDYLRETVADHDLQPHLRLGRRVRRVEWSSESSTWTVHVDGPDGVETYDCSFLYLAAGYYDNDGHLPDFPGVESFEGLLVHPQEWPADLDCAGRRVAVIGSGATAITLVPALAETAEKVFMVQRSPSYVAIDSDVDEEAERLRHELGDRAAFELVRERNLRNQQERYHAARTHPEDFKKPLFDAIEEIVGREVRERHFTPSYQPWDQRLCLVPNGDLFHAIADGRAEVVTGHIATFTAHGLRMESGEEIEADVVVAATGLKLVTFGKIDVHVDGERIDLAHCFTYKGVAFSGVPNLVTAFGYLNSSWTLRLELVNRFWSALLRRMDEVGTTQVVPALSDEEASMERRPWLTDVTSGYLVRHMAEMPAQGDHAPWINPQVHEQTKALLSDLDDGTLQFR